MRPYILRWLSSFFACAVAFFGVSASQQHPQSPHLSSPEKEILSVESAKNKAMEDGDIAALDRIYGDDLLFVDTAGRVLTKAARLQSYKSGNLKYVSFDQGDYRVHMYGDTAVIDGASCSVVNNHGHMISTPRRFTTIYVKLNGRWRYVAHQATVVAQAKDFPKCDK